MENNIGDARRDYAAMVGGFTQKDAAEYFGVSLSTYKKWEQGQGKLNGGILGDIAAKYGVTVDYLLGIVHKPVKTNPLSHDERELVDLYRDMNHAQRSALMEVARSMVVGNEKNETRNSEDVERAGLAVR